MRAQPADPALLLQLNREPPSTWWTTCAAAAWRMGVIHVAQHAQERLLLMLKGEKTLSFSPWPDLTRPSLRKPPAGTPGRAGDAGVAAGLWLLCATSAGYEDFIYNISPTAGSWTQRGSEDHLCLRPGGACLHS